MTGISNVELATEPATSAVTGALPTTVLTVPGEFWRTTETLTMYAAAPPIPVTENVYPAQWVGHMGLVGVCDGFFPK
jgi:hypothetical protein